MKSSNAFKIALAAAIVAVLAKAFFGSQEMIEPIVYWNKCFLKDQGECEAKKTQEFSVTPAPLSIPQEQLDDLKTRLSMRKPINGGILSDDPWENGMNPLYLEEILSYWENSYDWRREEGYINDNLSPHKTVIDGLDIFYLHVKPPAVSSTTSHEKSIPMLLLHGWPGSVMEFRYFIQSMHKLNPNYEFIIPSLPGYGFSQAAQVSGMNPCQMAVVVQKLMTQSLHFDKFFVQGGDWGSVIAHYLAFISPNEVLGTHINMPQVRTPIWAIPYVYFFHWEDGKRSGLLPLGQFPGKMLNLWPYLFQQATRPNSVGIGMQDSPVATAAWILDKFYSWTDPQSDISKGDLITNLMFYWLTGSQTTAATLYKEFMWSETSAQNIKFLAAQRFAPSVSISDFPFELFSTPEVVVRAHYKHIISYRKEDKGGHFAALEYPETLAKHVHEMVELQFTNS
mmetsp:Transcript_2808/g.3156  ORF Transcript_2808/g.3156 Transcript_2808/m.3156 type:complete len:452 (+) Transcript_2808:134-1489(+)